MKIKSKFKLTGLIPAIFSYLLFGLTSLFWGVNYGLYVLGSLMLIYSVFIFYAYYRTNHFGTLVSAIYMIVFGSFLLTFASQIIIGKQLILSKTSITLAVATVLLFVYILYLNFTRKLKWRGREILELAAQNIEQKTNSHTDRPLPIGNVDFSQDELYNFAKFFEKNLLGLTYKEDNRIVFMPLKYKNEFFALYNFNYNYKEKTWISVGNNGNVSVNISKQDYLDYKEDLAFNQLCKSLGDVIIEFIELYTSGREVRIIDKMDNLKISVFS
jgi:hypothetical protein